MPIEKITADDLRDMEHQEGLVLQGCGGEAQEWLDGINDLLTQDGILQNGSRFETVKVFQHDGLNNLLFPFENIQVDNINQIARKANAGFATKEDVRELKFLMRTIETKMTELVKQ